MPGPVNRGLPIDPALANEQYEYPYPRENYPNYQVPGPLPGTNRYLIPPNEGPTVVTGSTMFGFGWQFTPATTGIVRVLVYGSIVMTPPAGQTSIAVAVQLFIGTGVPPGAGAPETGSPFDSETVFFQLQLTSGTGGPDWNGPQISPFAVLATGATKLALGTTYWFDFACLELVDLNSAQLEIIGAIEEV